MKRSKLLAGGLVLSVAVNAFLLFSAFNPVVEDCPSNINSYTPGRTIPSADANKCVDNFQTNAPAGSLYGGIISGDAIKELLCPDNTNGIAYYFAQDPAGQIANGKVFLVLSGIHAEIVNNRISQLGTTGNTLYMPNSWCPTNCATLPQ